MNDGQFTPTTRQVRDGYRFDPMDDYHDPVNAGANADRNGRAFDRWLRRHEEKVMAEAWDEGAEFAWQRTGEGWNGEYTTYTHDGAVSFIEANDDQNPYRDK